MKLRPLCVISIGIALLVSGCTPTCKGDSCSRPQSTTDKMVIWWPPQMRVEPGPAGERPDYQTVSLQR
ncbi:MULTISPECIES: HrpT family type III secretion system protein [Pseudomonas]|uniref:HrpT family type III secretion system protein n=1 Tax=Pseudomonas pergaminensis TaxID=2853159 RepID=A0ABD7TJW0_9PSED|nr:MULTISPECIES: HrpT family type III secretion system protein [Pseudomonas]AQT92419.1 type III secretion protein [Pseudomonas azotoformans]MBT1259665.1 type III secretion protein [Pseudomonas sp. VS40]MBT1270699.1 type III secretion protein [Pseudomonas sp. VS59]PJK34890.1 type III secretion protein [Pseudomonas sp. S09F 262]PJK38832.1 type III secretion protein [Pseudomonas sp. S10E 269]